MNGPERLTAILIGAILVGFAVVFIPAFLIACAIDGPDKTAKYLDYAV